MAEARRYNLVQLIAVTTAVAAAMAAVYIIGAPPLGNSGLTEASLPGAILLVALWFCRRDCAARMALYAIVGGLFALVYCVRYMGASDWLFGHYHGPPTWMIVATVAAGVGLAASVGWFAARPWVSHSVEAPDSAPPPASRVSGLSWARLLGMGGNALFCGLVLLSGVGSLPRYREAMPIYVSERLLKQRLSVREWVERLSQRDAPLRPEMASMMTMQVATPDDAPAIPLLAELLDDSEPSVRVTAAATLQTLITISSAGRQGAELDPQTEACLARALDSPDPSVRQLVNQIMRTRSWSAPHTPAAVDSSAVARFVAALDGPDAERRRPAMAGLSSMGPPAAAAIPSLEAHLTQGDIGDRLYAALALSHIDPNSAAAIDFLGNALTTAEQPPRLRGLAAQRLGELGPAARASVPKFLEAWERRMITIQVAGFLHRIDSPAAARAGIPRQPLGP